MIIAYESDADQAKHLASQSKGSHRADEVRGLPYPCDASDKNVLRGRKKKIE